MTINNVDEMYEVFEKISLLKKIYWKQLDRDFFIIIHQICHAEYRPYSSTLCFLGYIEPVERKWIENFYTGSGRHLIGACAALIESHEGQGKTVSLEDIAYKLLSHKKIYTLGAIQRMLAIWSRTQLLISPHATDEKFEVPILEVEQLDLDHFKIWLPVYEINITEEQELSNNFIPTAKE